MELKEYLNKYKIDPVAFALEAHISVASIYNYLKGRAPHYRIALQIQQMTRGEVTAEELMKNAKR